MDKDSVFNAVLTKSELTHGRGYVYCLQYHIVWCTKYKKPVLSGTVQTDLENLFPIIACDNGIQLLYTDVHPDYVYLLIGIAPQVRVSDAIKILKGAAARQLFVLHPELKDKLWKGHLWNPSYLVATVSENLQDQIADYVSHQQTAMGHAGRPKKKA